VAGITGRGEARLLVIRIGGSVVLAHVTSGTGPARQFVVSIDVALCAGQTRVRSSECKARAGVVEAGIAPRIRAVARLASLWKVGLDVVGRGGVLEILQMA
jgi:hypothetical protein